VREFGGTWSESKLDCVEEYLAAYLQVMQKQEWWTLHYIDGFAGRGQQALRSTSETAIEGAQVESFFGDQSERSDTEEFLTGSALRALRVSGKATRPFDRFLFVDSDEASCRELHSIIASDFPALSPRVGVRCEDANTALERHIAETDWARVRAVVFLDPYGLEVTWDTIERLAGTEACDVWYLFPLGGVIRMMTKSGQIPGAWRTRLDRVFGSRDWEREFYRDSGQRSLLDDTREHLVRDATTGHMVEYVRQRLRSAFPAVSSAGILRNGRGAPLFALILGVSSKSKAAQDAALRIANHLVRGLNR
jgi:three-Cys-motif partner protein